MSNQEFQPSEPSTAAKKERIATTTTTKLKTNMFANEFTADSASKTMKKTSRNLMDYVPTAEVLAIAPVVPEMK